MNVSVNRQGLSRNIPAHVRREVRRRSKFGCVVCRSGFYEYEHIRPFADATGHDAEHICCLCEDCHSRVTRGQWSKELVRAKYAEVQAKAAQEIGPPRGPLDFHTGSAELAIGDLRYTPAVQTVVRYFGQDLVKLTPGLTGEPGMISAVFTDDDGNALLALEENEWIGSLDAWDLEITGQRITVRKKLGEIALRLRLDPPGRIVVERLDMRVGLHHILASESSYAVGVHFDDGHMNWISPHLAITKSTAQGIAIEINSRDELLKRYQYFEATGQGVGMISGDRRFIMHSPAGVMTPDLGISVASWCSFNVYRIAAGAKTLPQMRDAVFRLSAPEMRRFLASGTP